MLKRNGVTERGCGGIYRLALFVRIFQPALYAKVLQISPEVREAVVHRQHEKPQLLTPASDQELPFSLHCKTASLWLP